MKKYKLIQEYPGSPELGYESTPHKLDDNPKNHYWRSTWFNPEEWPTFWEEIIEYTPYKTHCTNGVITGVTRLSDSQYFNKGMYIKMPGHNDVGFIYSFEEKNRVLKIEHTFSFLMDKMGIKDHLKELRPCIYTKEDIMINLNITM